MKKLRYYLLILIPIFVQMSCTDTYELHQKYLKDGETIYTNKVDSIETLPGDSRLKISGYISNAFNVKEIIVYWNEEQNSQTFPYQKSENDTDPVELIVTELEETTYQFDIYSVDADGNRSVKVTAFGTSYGEIYRSNLEPRLFKSFIYEGDGNATMNFNIKSELTRDTEVVFTNLDGENISVIIDMDDTSAVLERIDLSEEVRYRTNYVPTAADEETGVETAIDEFTSDWGIYTMPSTLKPIADSFTFNSILGGVSANWENLENQEITFEFRKTVGGAVESTSVTSSEAIGNFEIREMESGTQNLEVVITDVYGNSYTEDFSVEPIGAYSRDLWTVIDFSSEEPKEATWDNGGQAIHAIDDSTATFWHSAWDVTQPDYPHHFTVDMGEEISILAFEVLGRSSNNNKAAGEHEFWVSTDNMNWTLIASYSGELSASKILIEATETTARYIRYDAVSAGSEDTNYTFLADLTVYAGN